MAEIQRIQQNDEWNRSYSDLSSSDEDLDDLGQGGVSSGKIRGAPKRFDRLNSPNGFSLLPSPSLWPSVVIIPQQIF